MWRFRAAPVLLFHPLMRWPRVPVQNVRPSRFNPPFCPWPDCTAHRSRGRGFHRNGSYRTLSSPSRVPRFVCLDCNRSCSRQTFSTTYYLKRPELLIAIASGLAACSCHRQLARSLHCAKTTVTRQADRLGRHAILFHARCNGQLPALAEAVVHDHFEVFVGRQDHALGVGTAVGATSRYVYDIDPAPHRGSGRRPDRKQVGATARRRRSSYVASIRRSIRGLMSHLPEAQPLVLRVDGRLDYRAALGDPVLGSRVTLQVYPNPERGPKGTPRSREAIRRDLAMFPVDSLHQLLRHSCADHKRETIAFGRRLESIVGRAHLMAVWKNFVKARSERAPDRTTPAMQLGITDERWRFERFLSRRLFSHRETVSECALRIYQKRWTASLPKFNRRHAA
jgi:transposase-like protein